MHRKLFIPGPTEVSPDVLEAMSQPLIGHRGSQASELGERISRKLAQLMETENLIVLSTSSGSGLMEGAVRCFTARRAAVFSIGAFGERWYKMCRANGIAADIIRSPEGQATTPAQIEEALATGNYDVITVTHNETATGVANDLAALAAVWSRYPDVVVCIDAVSSLGGDRIPCDELGIDCLITSSQKCIGLPPGLAVAAVSQKALDRAETVPNRGLYFDYLELARFIRERGYQYPATPNISLYFALDRALDLMLEEGFAARYARHAAMAERVREWAGERFALFADPEHLSQTVTCIANTRGIDVGALNRWLGTQGFQISDGYGSLKGKTFRIAHMGWMELADIEELLATIDRWLDTEEVKA
ncbi:MAG: alanine--glyoxylate aminotransferase family protein [Bacillota bacterium]|nr:alanine--glyoxylate aminotransferase family protein [Bacillota bacterium]